MKLQELYAFSEVTYKDGILVSNGREKSTGRPVQVHLFPSSRTNDAMELCQQVMSLPEKERSLVLKAGQGEGGGYFVTEPLPDGLGLEKWMAAAAAKTAPNTLPEVSSETAGQLRQMGLYPAALAPIVPGPEPQRLNPQKPEALRPEPQRKVEAAPPPPLPSIPTAVQTPVSAPDTSRASPPPPVPSGATQFISHLYGGAIASTTPPPAPVAPAAAPPAPVAPTPVAAPAPSSQSPGPADILESIYGKAHSQTAPEPSTMPATLRNEPVVQPLAAPPTAKAPSANPAPSEASQFLKQMFRVGPDPGFDDSTHAYDTNQNPAPPPAPAPQTPPKPPVEIDIMEKVYGNQPTPAFRGPVFEPEPAMPVHEPPTSQGKGTGLETFLFGKSTPQQPVRAAVVPTPPSPVAQTPAAPFFAPEPPAAAGPGFRPPAAAPYPPAPYPPAPPSAASEPLWGTPEPPPAASPKWGGAVPPGPVSPQPIPAKPDSGATPRPTPSSTLRSGSKVPGTLDLKTMLVIVAILLVLVALIVGLIEFLG